MIKKIIFTILFIISLIFLSGDIEYLIPRIQAANDSILPNLDDPELEAALQSIRTQQATDNSAQQNQADTATEATNQNASSAVSLEQLQQLFKSFETIDQGNSANNSFELDLIWKTNTLVPFDYPGKALPGTLSGITIYALANVPNPERLEYNWIVDDASSYREGPDQVGIGQSIFNWATFIVPGFTHKIKVTAKDPVSEKSASAALTFKTQKPQIYTYFKNNDNFNNLAPKTLNLSPDQEISLLIRPFYFNVLSINDFDFAWYLNNKLIQENNAQPDILPIHIAKEMPAGSRTNLRLEVINKRQKQNINEKISLREDIEVIEK